MHLHRLHIQQKMKACARKQVLAASTQCEKGGTSRRTWRRTRRSRLALLLLAPPPFLVRSASPSHPLSLARLHSQRASSTRCARLAARVGRGPAACCRIACTRHPTRPRTPPRPSPAPRRERGSSSGQGWPRRPPPLSSKPSFPRDCDCAGRSSHLRLLLLHKHKPARTPEAHLGSRTNPKNAAKPCTQKQGAGAPQVQDAPTRQPATRTT